MGFAGRTYSGHGRQCGRPRQLSPLPGPGGAERRRRLHHSLPGLIPAHGDSAPVDRMGSRPFRRPVRPSLRPGDDGKDRQILVVEVCRGFRHLYQSRSGGLLCLYRILDSGLRLVLADRRFRWAERGAGFALFQRLSQPRQRSFSEYIRPRHPLFSDHDFHQYLHPLARPGERGGDRQQNRHAPAAPLRRLSGGARPHAQCRRSRGGQQRPRRAQFPLATAV